MAKSALAIDMLTQAPQWEGREAGLTRALEAAAALEGAEGAVSVLLGDDAALAALNRQFRGKDGPTNVLSFSAAAGAAGLFGDLALAAETIAREAENQGKSFENHAAHMIVHGFLHLLGYTHDGAEDAAAMEARERAILAGLGIGDPYA